MKVIAQKKGKKEFTDNDKIRKQNKEKVVDLMDGIFYPQSTKNEWHLAITKYGVIVHDKISSLAFAKTKILGKDLRKIFVIHESENAVSITKYKFKTCEEDMLILERIEAPKFIDRAELKESKYDGVMALIIALLQSDCEEI